MLLVRVDACWCWATPIRCGRQEPGPSRDQGASAIAALAPMVAPLEGLTDKTRGVSATVGLFRGGSARQVVPSDAEIHLDLRAADADGAAWLLAETRRIASMPPADSRVTVSVEGDSIVRLSRRGRARATCSRARRRSARSWARRSETWSPPAAPMAASLLHSAFRRWMVLARSRMRSPAGGSAWKSRASSNVARCWPR